MSFDPTLECPFSTRFIATDDRCHNNIIASTVPTVTTALGLVRQRLNGFVSTAMYERS